MELPSIGLQCSEPNCKQLDFLPLKCKCELIFCSEHFTKHSLSCPVVQTQKDPVMENTIADYICSYPSCNSRSYVPLLCQKCKKHFCVTHRHITECAEKEPEVVAAELEKFIAPVREFNAAKQEIDRQLDESISKARKKPKTQQMANKVQLMRIKNKATGLKTIPTTDRVYFNVHHPKNMVSKVSPIFVSKTWSLGRAIDSIAEECKVVNKNNQSTALKLRLFHKLSGEILSTDLTTTLEVLLLEQAAFDGEELVLEYVDNNYCMSLNLN